MSGGATMQFVFDVLLLEWFCSALVVQITVCSVIY